MLTFHFKCMSLSLLGFNFTDFGNRHIQMSSTATRHLKKTTFSYSDDVIQEVLLLSLLMSHSP